jgi:hypothetical protein
VQDISAVLSVHLLESGLNILRHVDGELLCELAFKPLAQLHLALLSLPLNLE